MGKFTKVESLTDIKSNGTIIRKGTKGMILRVNENNLFVRFCTGKMVEVPAHSLLAI